MISHFKLRACCLALLSLFVAVGAGSPVWAQEGGTYTEPTGRMTVPLPVGWTDKSGEKFGHFTLDEPAADLWLIAIEQTDLDKARQAVFEQIAGTLLPLAKAEPLQRTDAPLPSGKWTQMTYLQDGGIVVLVLGTIKADAACFIIARFPGTKAQPIGPVLNNLVLGVTFSADESTPSYADLQAFSEREIVVETQSDAGTFKLPGTLSLPNGDGPFPAVVLVHGSGPNNRNEALGPNKPFRDLAWGLATQGIAVLRYDKRTLVYGAESAKPIESLTVEEETIQDALSAAALLRGLPEIDPTQVFVAGHSLGGYLTPRIGAGDPELAGLIILAGNTRRLEDIIIVQTEYLAALDGTVSAADKTQIETYRKATEAIKALNEADKGKAGLMLLGAPAAYWLDLRAYEPTQVANEIAHPLLILQGERDYQVTLAEDFAGWQTGLAERKDVTFKSYPGLTHLFMAGQEGAEGLGTPEDYSLPGHIPAGVIDDIAGWIKALSAK